MKERKITVKEFAKIVGRGEKTVRRWIRNRTFFKTGEVISNPKGYWILESAYERYCKDNAIIFPTKLNK